MSHNQSHPESTPQNSAQSEVQALVGRWSKATQTKDIDQQMSLYMSDITYFDVVPPLQYSGLEAVQRNFTRWFESWESAIGSEIRDLKISASGDVAVAHMLHRTSGILKTRREVDYWVRASLCCRRTNQQWLIWHEHISLPIDPKTQGAAMDLVP